MKTLGIETSCDETGLAIYDSKHGLLAHTVYSQTEIHAEFGGVVPELASRDHIRKILPLLNEVLSQASLTLNDIDGIAYTAGPGLVGALMVGASFARTLGFALNIPTVGVHHMEGHLLAAMLEEEKPTFPFLALLVSGGHTMLVKVTGLGQYKLLGESIDDAAGEAFDKTAKLLGLPYPGGPVLAKLAEKGVSGRFDFPRPMIDRPGLDFSFSGLKTSVLYTVKKIDNLTEQTKADVARSFEDAVVETLTLKCRRAMRQTGLKNIIIAGGVGANKRLRQSLISMTKKEKGQAFFPKPEFCTDNGAMIAYVGCQRLLAGGADKDLTIKATPRWRLEDLM